MKKLLIAVLVLLMALLGVLLANTIRFRSKQLAPAAIQKLNIDPDLAAKHLSGAIRIKTDTQPTGQFSGPSPFADLQNYLQESFPKAHSVLLREVAGMWSLLYIWKGKNDSAKPILLMSHMDVVPVAPGSEGKWEKPPFEGAVSGGYIWGRGALDDKVSVIGIMEAVEALVSQGYQPERSIYIAFGHDEEVGGAEGAGSIAAVLRQRGVKFESILDEGGLIASGIMPGIEKPVALVGIAEKGYLSLDLTVESEGGHSSIPPKHTTIGTLAEALRKLEANPLPSRLRGATAKTFEYLGPEMPFLNRLAFANLWLTRPFVENIIGDKPSGDASIRTTTAITMVDGGVKDNVLPPRAHAVVNFRLYPGDTIDSVTEHVRSVVADEKVKILKYENHPAEASAESDTSSPGFLALQQTITDCFPNVIVAPYLLSGATDTRHYADLSSEVFRFVPMQLSSEDLSRIHGNNERISVDNFAQLVQFYVQLMKASTKSK